MKIRLAVLVPILMLCLISACATTVRLEVRKPAEIDMRGARTIAVMDFGYTAGASESLEDFLASALIRAFGGESWADAEVRSIARYATDTMIARLHDTGYFTIVSSRDLRGAFSGRSSDIGAVEIGERLGAKAILVGEITTMKTDDDRFTRKEKIYDERLKKKIRVEVPWVKRTAELGLSYRVVETGGGTIIATKSFRERMEEEQPVDKRSDLTEADDLYREMIGRIMGVVARQLAPHVEFQTRSLMADAAKDPRMGQADDLVKKGFLDDALDVFLEVWNETGNTAAGYNGAILYEARGEIDQAVRLMESVVDATQDEAIFREYERLQNVRDEWRRAEEQMQ